MPLPTPPLLPTTGPSCSNASFTVLYQSEAPATGNQSSDGLSKGGEETGYTRGSGSAVLTHSASSQHVRNTAAKKMSKPEQGVLGRQQQACQRCRLPLAGPAAVAGIPHGVSQSVSWSSTHLVAVCLASNPVEALSLVLHCRPPAAQGEAPQAGRGAHTVLRPLHGLHGRHLSQVAAAPLQLLGG